MASKKSSIAAIFVSPYTLEELSKTFPGKIHVVFGNVDGDVFHYQARNQQLANCLMLFYTEKSGN